MPNIWDVQQVPGIQGDTQGIPEPEETVFITKTLGVALWPNGYVSVWHVLPTPMLPITLAPSDAIAFSEYLLQKMRFIEQYAQVAQDIT